MNQLRELGFPGACALAAAPAAMVRAAQEDVPANPLKDAYFGGEPVHAGVSMDAFIARNRLMPDDASQDAEE